MSHAWNKISATFYICYIFVFLVWFVKRKQFEVKKSNVVDKNETKIKLEKNKEQRAFEINTKEKSSINYATTKGGCNIEIFETNKN